MYSFVAQEIQAGRQAYVVYPVVEETELAAVKAAEKMHKHLSTKVFPGVRVGLLHGKLSAEDRGAAMRSFIAGETKILVATTVIEVGVDVSNASVMVIEQAERFGLAQIHQLRGRVGRSSQQSYCILVTGKLNEIAQERIRTLVTSNDGFYIAEMDMRLRGPGEFFGTRQSGIPGLRLADLLRDADVLELARGEAKQLLESGNTGGVAGCGPVHSGTLATQVRLGASGLRMRVIAGEFRSRRIKSVPGLEVRPTPDRLREALFNVLAPRIAGAVFLDCYAGSGSVGIEALSRGAKRAIFIEKNGRALDVLRDNLKSLGIEEKSASRARIEQGARRGYCFH